MDHQSYYLQERGRISGPFDLDQLREMRCDNRLARSLCGWQPRVSIEEGLERCAEFVQRQPQMYHPEEYQR